MSASKRLITYVTLILDQSGSMSSKRKQAVEGYNEQIQQMKLNAKDQDIRCSLVTFNGDVYEHQWLESAEKLNEAVESDYPANGSTAFRDAVGYTIKRLQESTDVNEENISYLVIIISDGAENASKHIGENELKERIQSCQNTGKWTFSYMGCNKEYVEQMAQDTSIPIANMAVWNSENYEVASRGMHSNAARVGKFYKARARGKSATSNLYSDAECLADYTEADPSLGKIYESPAIDNASVASLGKIYEPPAIKLKAASSSNAPTPFCNKSNPVKWC